MRGILAILAGSLFGIGLLISDMVDTTRVQSFLDPFGNWDPTLAFVMGGAIIPMFFAWRIAAKRRTPVAGGRFPENQRQEITPRLAVGSVLFGSGWGLAGLCPGSAIASITFGGMGGVTFLVAMTVGMWIAALASNLFAR